MSYKLSTLAFAVVLASTGCAATDSGGASSGTRTASGSGDCNADAVQNLVGQSYTDRLGETARNRAGAAQLRAVHPGQVMTMEYRPTRLTIVIGEDERVQSIRCG